MPSQLWIKKGHAVYEACAPVGEFLHTEQNAIPVNGVNPRKYCDTGATNPIYTNLYCSEILNEDSAEKRGDIILNVDVCQVITRWLE